MAPCSALNPIEESHFSDIALSYCVAHAGSDDKAGLSQFDSQEEPLMGRVITKKACERAVEVLIRQVGYQEEQPLEHPAAQ